MRRRPPPAPNRPRWRRIAAVIAVVVAAYALALFVCQASLIYQPRRYAAETVTAPPAGLRALAYRVDGQHRTAFWRPPAADGAGRWWVVFSGNAGLALDWADTVAAEPDPGAGWLLIDHPGFGANDGAPSPSAIDRNADAALAALAAERGVAVDALACSVLGHSLGAAVGLRFATRHPVRRVVALAPFTTLVAMARRQVGWPFCEVLTHRYDNRAALHALAAQRPRPWVTVLHGDADALVPEAMCRSLGDEFPWVAYRELHRVGHDDLVGRIPELRAAMTGMEALAEAR